MRDFTGFSFGPAKFLLPKEGTELGKWSVIACDQFTSLPEYWDSVENARAGAPSALDIIYPEAWLSQDPGRIEHIHEKMREYARDLLTREVEGFVLVERETGDGVRVGLLGAIDLEQYDFSADSVSAVRPTEGTVAERVPPRVQVRRNACLEMGHVLLLADDPEKTLIEPLYAQREKMPLLYDFELMHRGGQIRGWQVGEEWYGQIVGALCGLKKAGQGLDFAVGDGNHSLAAARTCWNEIRAGLLPQELESHPARWAMAEVGNLHDGSLVFHSIHRALYGPCGDLLSEMQAYLRARGMDLRPCAEDEADFRRNGAPYAIVNKINPLPVGVLQPFLDAYVEVHADVEIDYIHGGAELARLQGDGATGIWLPAMDKAALFPSVRLGPLPRKTFSMGAARDKRYYLECKRI